MVHLQSNMTEEEVELWMDVDYEKETAAGTGAEWGVDLFYLSTAPLI